jgi:lysozyme family protein
MLHPFEALRTDYAARFVAARVTRQAAASAAASRLIINKQRYASMQVRAGIPAALLMALGEREAGTGVFHSYFGNGEAIIGTGRKSHLVPVGRGPFMTWEAGVLDAVAIDGLDKIAQWSIARALYEAELYNGFGYRQYGIHSPYLWAGTDQYTVGKYRSDGKYDANLEDAQLGVVPILKALFTRDATLMIPGEDGLKIIKSAPPISPDTLPPTPIGIGGFSTGPLGSRVWTIRLVQEFINQMGQTPPITEDNSFGKETKRAVAGWQAAHALEADGYPGPITTGVMSVCLKEATFFTAGAFETIEGLADTLADRFDAARGQL